MEEPLFWLVISDWLRFPGGVVLVSWGTCSGWLYLIGWRGVDGITVVLFGYKLI
jgi:hypothetical protein